MDFFFDRRHLSSDGDLVLNGSPNDPHGFSSGGHSAAGIQETGISDERDREFYDYDLLDTS